MLLHQQPWPLARGERHRAHQFRIIAQPQLLISLRPAPVKHILTPGVAFLVQGQQGHQLLVTTDFQMTRLPAAATANRPGGFQSVKIFIAQKRISGACQLIPAGLAQLGNPINKTKLVTIHTLLPSGSTIEPPNGNHWEVLLLNPNEIHYYLHIETNDPPRFTGTHRWRLL